jgi:hypothetical protein
MTAGASKVVASIPLIAFPSWNMHLRGKLGVRELFFVAQTRQHHFSTAKKDAAKCLDQSDLRYYLARPKHSQVPPGWFRRRKMPTAVLVGFMRRLCLAVVRFTSVRLETGAWRSRKLVIEPS